MSNEKDRNLTEEDVKAIVSELKIQLLTDLRIEVGKGVLVWVKRAMWLLLLYLAALGISGDRTVLQQLTEARGR